MCPGQERESAGDCGVCGMALVQAFRLGAEDHSNAETLVARRRFVLAALCSAPVLALAMTADLAPSLGLREFFGDWWSVCLGVPSIAVAFGPARILLARGARSVAARRLNMFSLLSLGILASLGVSLWSTLLPSTVPASMSHHGHPPLYFEAAAVIATLALFGQWLEARATRATGDALRCVLALAPQVVAVLDGSDHERSVPLSDVTKDMRFRVRPGERVALDGLVESGESSVDESLLNGEPLPKRRAAGDAVIGGALNIEGTLVVRATASGDDGFLAGIAKCVIAAQNSRTPAQDLADSLSAIFVPIVMLIAVGAAGVWLALGGDDAASHALAAFISVVVVACPCALGLATPMAVTVAAGQAARSSILFRDVGAMERLAQANLFVFDKTGTLSEGRPSIASFDVQLPFDEREVLRLAASAEQGSEHPAAKSLVRHARGLGIANCAATSFVNVPGRGVRAVVDEKEVVVGSRLLAASSTTDPLPTHTGSLAFVIIDGRLAACVRLQDTPVAEAKRVIDALHASGAKTLLATGDSATGGEHFLQKAGIAPNSMAMRAELLPQEKAALITQLRREGNTVVFIGDGVNDTPALLVADVGIAVSGATDAASAAASIHLLRRDVTLVLRARTIALTLSATIRQNLALAFGYNLIAIPIAAGALYPILHRMTDPMIAALAMSVSSFLVIANSLRQTRSHH